MRLRHLFLGTALAHACFFVDVTEAARSLASMVPAHTPVVGQWLHQLASYSPSYLAIEARPGSHSPR